MSDPAIEAAKRAWSREGWGRGEPQLSEGALAIAAASEALAPLRDIHRPFTRDYPGGDNRTVCNHCLGPVDWPCLTARYLYTSDELAAVPSNRKANHDER
ncbi:hypothetical protein BST17_24790 [Mycolicibacterium bacteremicum]|uniref:Uncharacterized protein n=1 Tax=Mycolicibacterium bacteremicum TaxID=564198 RepID=A0A1W9YPY9_MYCBA|nr:hypothetical protein BST17_24790 [Mycolicibacterium bacteremicum]